MDQEVVRTPAIPQTWDIHPPRGLCEPGDPAEGQEESICVLICHGRHRMHELSHQYETSTPDWHTTETSYSGIYDHGGCQSWVH